MSFVKRYLVFLAMCAVLAVGILFTSEAQLTGASSCSSLIGLSLPDTTIISATEMTAPFVTTVATNSAPTFTVPGPFPFCLIRAKLTPTSDSNIQVEVWLPSPTKWNGKFVGLGNGGLTGAIRHASMVRPLWSGYAVANSDLGHPGSNASFAFGHPEKLIDYAHRADHLTAMMAKAVVRAYYGAAPRLSYFHGCSNGGHQGLMEAQRYTDDYDGIIAGAPWNQWTHQIIEFISRTMALEQINRAKLPLITSAVVAQCGGRDGGLSTDGYLNDPRDCHFKPRALECKGADETTCLTAQEVKAVERIYEGPRNPETGRSLFPGFERGSEFGWSGLGAFVNSLFQNMVYESNPTWDYHTFNFSSDVAFFDTKLAGLLNSNSPDLRAFEARGGKLISFHGWIDTTLEPRNTVNYYNSVVAVTGGGLDLSNTRRKGNKHDDDEDDDDIHGRREALERTQDFYRLFMAPGMSHCRGGIGPNDIGQTGTPDAHVGAGFPPIDPDHDLLAALDRWVEHGIAPRKLIASHFTNGVLDRARPLCPYPQVAHYRGKGDPNDSASFVCVNDWDDFKRDFSHVLKNIRSAVKHGELDNLPN